jgi:hypothetical protein
MTVTEKQLLVLLQTTVGSTTIEGGLRVFHFDRETRRRIANEVLNQQTAVLTAVRDEGASA